MNRITALVLISMLLFSCSSRQEAQKSDGTEEIEWELVWADEFDSDSLDVGVWSRITAEPEGNPDWKVWMSDDDSCYELKDGKLLLKAIQNPGVEGDDRAYLTGGVTTEGKLTFYEGKVEVCVKFGSAQGAWPAIWMLGEDEAGVGWPGCGEIDLMEHLNYDDFVYQTLHSLYTENVSNEEPDAGITRPISKNSYNVYGVILDSDSITMLVNDYITNVYPRTGPKNQFPFDQPFYLLVDMQLGGPGTWVGTIEPSDLPIDMAVDYVRYYKKK